MLRILIPQAIPHERAGLLSAIYVVSYLANSVPAVAAGAVTGKAGLLPTAIGYTGAVMVLALFSPRRTVRPVADSCTFEPVRQGGSSRDPSVKDHSISRGHRPELPDRNQPTEESDELDSWGLLACYLAGTYSFTQGLTTLIPVQARGSDARMLRNRFLQGSSAREECPVHDGRVSTRFSAIIARVNGIAAVRSVTTGISAPEPTTTAYAEIPPPSKAAAAQYPQVTIKRLS